MRYSNLDEVNLTIPKNSYVQKEYTVKTESIRDLCFAIEYAKDKLRADPKFKFLSDNTSYKMNRSALSKPSSNSGIKSISYVLQSKTDTLYILLNLDKISPTLTVSSNNKTVVEEFILLVTNQSGIQGNLELTQKGV